MRQTDHQPQIDDRIYRRLAIATAVGGAVMVTFWTLYLLANDQLGLVDPAHMAFENSFVFADTLLATLLFAASASLSRRRRAAPFLLAVAASMTIYLGLLDATFYGRSGEFYPLTANGAMELAIILACLGGGLYGLHASWTIWQTARVATTSDHQTTPVPASVDDQYQNLRVVA